MTIAHKHLSTALAAIPAWAQSIQVKRLATVWVIHCSRGAL